MDAGIVSVGRRDEDVLVQILEVEGGRQKTNPFGGFLAVPLTDNSLLKFSLYVLDFFFFWFGGWL